MQIIKKFENMEPKYSAILDIWSDSNMRTSLSWLIIYFCLGVSIQFINKNSNAIELIFFEMRPLLKSHTGC